MLGYLAALLIAYAAILISARIFEKRLIFFPNVPGRLDGDWNPRGLPVEEKWLTTADGVRLHSWWIPNPDAKFTFLAFHGNASNIAARADAYRFLFGIPANVLAVEYRGYGRSQGSPSENGLYLDAQAAYDFALGTLGIPRERIVSFGQSLGTAVAVDLATRRPVAGLILEAPFPSTHAVARHVYPFVPGIGLVAKSKFDTAGKLGKIHAPLLVVHCIHDPVIAYVLGEEVFRIAPEPKTFLPIDASCHEEASILAPERYRQQLWTFLNGIPGA